MNIAIYGATGTTGSLVVERAAARGDGVRPVSRVADLAPQLAGVDVVINCAGPFLHTRRPIEDAAMAAHVPVVHICGEPSQLSDMFARDADFKAAGIAVVGGAAFSSAVSDLACWLAARSLDRVTAVEVAHGAVGSMPSEGSLRSYLADVDAEGDRAPADMQVRALPDPVGARAVRRVTLGETLTLSRRYPGATVGVYVAVGPPRLVAAHPSAFMRDRAALERMLALRAASTRGPSAEERSQMAFVLLASVRGEVDGSAVEHIVTLTGADPYGVTAALALSAACEVAHVPAGAHAPLDVLQPQPTLASLAHMGVRFRIDRATN